ncbi:hypothetical protein [Curtobacterium sp. 18060]|uniref:hypothetical protein n=1 Tax=Curtobacterium sp. 18060 TaxID=2681408 RepID=UPI0013583E1F|nr:hypothetical protein [Curtobacterium sp. 18060]
MMSFSKTAHGWLVAVGGATLIGIKQTCELVETLEWPVIATWTITAAALLLFIGNAAITANRTE